MSFSTVVAGAATVSIATKGGLAFLSLDGRPLFDVAELDAPHWDPNAFGGHPAMCFQNPIGAGEHELLAVVGPNPGPLPQLTVSIAAMVRVDGPCPERHVGPWEARASDAEAWTETEDAAEEGAFPWPPTPARILRGSFAMDRAVRSARLYVAALGAYQVTLNGTKLGDAALQPDPTDFRVTVPYRAFDVGSLVTMGENVIGATVADGFFASYAAPTGRYSFGAAPRRLRVMLVIEDVDGRTLRFSSGEAWRHAPSSISRSEIYNGEDRDLRDEPAHWQLPGFDDSGWESCWTAPVPQGALVAPLAPPIRETRVLRPVSIDRRSSRRHIVDFGQNFAGRIRLRLSGIPGTTVTLRHAEIIDEAGELDVANLRAAKATDTFILAHDGQVELEPQFTYHGFRYAEISGIETLEGVDVEGVVMSTAATECGTVEIGNPMVQKLWENTLWSQRSNFVGVPTDCPQRDERLGWTGDAQIFWDTAAYNMDVGSFTRAFTREMRNAQEKDGSYPMWAPRARVVHPIAATPLPGWADAGVELPYVAFLHSGDRQVVDENWDAMARYVDGILARSPDHVWRVGRGFDLGDWLSLDATAPMDETTPKTLIATAMLARSIGQVAALADWTGRTEEAALRSEQACLVRTAFAREFVRPDGVVGNGSHTSYILALRLNLVPPELRARAGALLAADIRARGTLLSTGFLGTPYALDALADVGEVELAYSLLLRTEYPSWGYMVARGATTIWERWNGDVGDVAMNSYNHYALGAVCSFLYRRVAGIEPLEPGFARFRIAPLLDPRIPSARATYDSARGRILSSWRATETNTRFEVEIPANSVAELHVPGRVVSTSVELEYDSSADVSSGVATPGTHTFQLGLSADAVESATALL